MIADVAKICTALEEYVHGGRPFNDILKTYEGETVEQRSYAVLSSCKNAMRVMDWERIEESAMSNGNFEREEPSRPRLIR